REDAKTLSIFGTGVQGLYHAMAIPAVRKIEKILVPRASPEHPQAFADPIQSLADAQAVPARSAAEGAPPDTRRTGSPPPTPIFSGSLLRDGAHVRKVGSHSMAARGMDAESVVRSHVVVGSYDACWAESGDIMIPINEGAIGKEHVAAELGEVVLGSKSARSS